MTNFDSISKQLVKQISVMEKNVKTATDRMRNVEAYINCRVIRVRRLIHLMKKSKDWTNKLSRVVNILGDIQMMVDKIEDVEASIAPIEEVCIDDLEHITSLVDKKLMEYTFEDNTYGMIDG